MFKLSGVLLPLVGLSFLVGCSSDDPAVILEDILNKDSLTLSNLDNHAVTYKNTSTTNEHVDVYCPGGVLKDVLGAVLGTWSEIGDDLVTNAITYHTTNATLVKNTTYTTSNASSVEVTNIAETPCL